MLAGERERAPLHPVRVHIGDQERVARLIADGALDVGDAGRVLLEEDAAGRLPAEAAADPIDLRLFRDPLKDGIDLFLEVGARERSGVVLEEVGVLRIAFSQMGR